MSPNIELDSCLSVSIFGYTIISSTEFIHKIVYCSKKEKIEYDDLAAIADQKKISIAEVRRRIEKERKK